MTGMMREQFLLTSGSEVTWHHSCSLAPRMSREICVVACAAFVDGHRGRGDRESFGGEREVGTGIGRDVEAGRQRKSVRGNEREHDASLGVGPSLSPEILPYRLCKHGPV